MTPVAGEVQTPAKAGQTISDRTRSHRQLLANLDRYGDSSSDLDGTDDDEASLMDAMGGSNDPDSVLGVSMGKSQLRLKSPATPAVEKAKALENSGSFFSADAEANLPDDGDDRYRRESDQSPEQLDRLPSPWKAPGSRPRSSTTIKQKLDDLVQTRKRAYSGPTALLNSIRKILPDLSTSALPKSSLTPSSTSAKTEQNRNDAEMVTSPVSERSPPIITRSPTRLSPVNTKSSEQKPSLPGFDGSSLSMQTQESPRPLRRTTSENSLYLRRVVTGGSEFDDVTVYSGVADMPNSRFKAIQDSLHDSAIRFPRITENLLALSQGVGERLENGITKLNTEVNRRLSVAVGPNEAAMPRSQQIPARKESTHPILKEALSRMTGDLVIMGGYRGSILRSAEPPHQQVWIPVKVGLNLRKVDLEVGLTHEDEERMPGKIIPSGILSHIGPIDISRRLLKKIRKCPQVKSNQLRVHDWGYDWRLSPHLLAKQLINFLESLGCNRPQKPPALRGAVVVAHSLGGLITRYAVNQRPDLFAGVIYAGTPQNCVNILGPLRNGDDVLLSSRVLTAQVNFTLRTSFALLPESGRCFLNKDTGERYDVDFFDPQTWEEHRLSPCISPALPSTSKRRSLVSSISDSISSFHPSLPSKRGTLFSTSDSQGTTKDKAEEAKDTIETTLRTVERVTSPEHAAAAAAAAAAAGQSLEPSMKSSPKASIATTVTIPKDKAWEYLGRTLSEIKAFKADLAHRTDHQELNRYPPQAIIFGQTVPTVYGAKVASREAIKYSDAYDDLAFASGDGVVLASAAQLPVGYRCVKGGRVKSDRGHVGLLGDLEGVGQCIAAVLEGRRRGIGLGPEYNDSKYKGIQL